MNTLPDGIYDVFVIDAEDVGDGTIRVEVTITTGEHKGDVLALQARNMGADAVALLGSPATLIVENSLPRLTFS